MSDRRQGFTLLEMMIYVAVVSVVMTVATLVYLACWDHALGVARNTTDIVRTLEAGERWREDVRRAPSAPALVDGVLEVPADGGAVRYRHAADAVERRVGQGDWLPFLRGVAASRMVLDEGKEVSSWRWEIELKVRKRRTRVQMRPLFTFRSVATR